MDGVRSAGRVPQDTEVPAATAAATQAAIATRSRRLMC